MSFRINEVRSFNFSNLSSNDFALAEKSNEELRVLFHEIMKKGLHGLCFSIYENGQSPGDVISKEQVRKRLEIIRPYTQWVRSFSCLEGNEWVPIIAKEMGMKTLVGAWLGNDKAVNEKEINALIDLAKRGYVDIASVGNEVLYRNYLSVEELIKYIQSVKQAIPKVPVGYVDAYYEFTRHAQLTAQCDVILSNCYPFWEGCPSEYALGHMAKMYEQAQSADWSKKVIITETGWPSDGESHDGAVPSLRNALIYFIETQLWAQKEGIETFYFASFDEVWKVNAEGGLGAFWGLWGINGKLKF